MGIRLIGSDFSLSLSSSKSIKIACVVKDRLYLHWVGSISAQKIFPFVRFESLLSHQIFLEFAAALKKNGGVFSRVFRATFCETYNQESRVHRYFISRELRFVCSLRLKLLFLLIESRLVSYQLFETSPVSCLCISADVSSSRRVMSFVQVADFHADLWCVL